MPLETPLPLDRHGGGGQAGADGTEDELVAGVESLLHLAESQGDAGAGGVADVVDVEEELFEGDAAPLGSGFEDSPVRLVRDDPAGLFERPTALDNHLLDDAAEVLGGQAEQCAAFEPDPRINVALAVGHLEPGLRTACHVDASGIGAELDVADTVPCRGGRDDGRPGHVAEDEVGVAVGGVQKIQLDADWDAVWQSTGESIE